MHVIGKISRQVNQQNPVLDMVCLSTHLRDSLISILLHKLQEVFLQSECESNPRMPLRTPDSEEQRQRASGSTSKREEGGRRPNHAFNPAKRALGLMQGARQGADDQRDWEGVARMSSFDKVNIRCVEIIASVKSASQISRYLSIRQTFSVRTLIEEFKFWHIMTVNPRRDALEGSNIHTSP